MSHARVTRCHIEENLDAYLALAPRQRSHHERKMQAEYQLDLSANSGTL